MQGINYTGKYLEMIGKKYGLLTVGSIVGKNRHGQPMVKCKCNCGKETVTRAYSLVQGKAKSCGCEQTKSMRESNIKHNAKHTRLYGIWGGMKTRCYNNKSDFYTSYGGKGITICCEWLYDFCQFRDWSMQNGYDETKTIDRKDNAIGYNPSNCKWSSQKEQANNRTNNSIVFFEGHQFTVSEICEKYSISKSALYTRISRKKEIQEWLNKAINL